MSKQIAQTVGDARVAILIALLAMFAVLATVATQWRTSSAQDPPDIGFTKVCVEDQPNTVICTLRVINLTPMIENEESGTFEPHVTRPGTLTDILPDIGVWGLLDATAYAEPGVYAGTPECEVNADTIVCAVPPIIGRHLNEDENDFASGFVEVTIYGITNGCGQGRNTAVLTGTVLLRSTAAVFGNSCATATPTPTSIPTATPTANPPTATPTLNDPVPTVTPTRRAPLPPNTGDSPPGDDSLGTAYVLYVLLGFGALAFGIAGTAIYKRRC